MCYGCLPYAFNELASDTFSDPTTNTEPSAIVLIVSERIRGINTISDSIQVKFVEHLGLSILPHMTWLHLFVNVITYYFESRWENTTLSVTDHRFILSHSAIVASGSAKWW